MSAKTTAIIMRSKDEMPYAVTALERLAGQTWKDWTLYNVDSGSRDGTLDAVRKFNPDRVTEIPPTAYVPGKVLNEMIARTREEFIVFLNADAIPLNEFWLERLLRPLLDGTADATMSKQHARPNAHFIVDYDYRRAYDPKNIKAENEDFFSAVACAFRRSWWDRIKFPESGYAEDLAWAKACREQGARLKLVLDSEVEHSHNYTLKSLYTKKFRHGLTYHRMYGQNPQIFRQTYACLREIVRDGLYACRRLKLGTIPYNLAYRIVIHVALHKGLRQAASTGSAPGLRPDAQSPAHRNLPKAASLSTPMEPEPDFAALQARLGAVHTQHRLLRQTNDIARILGGGRTRIHIENMTWLHGLIAAGLTLAGLRRQSRHNALSPVVRQNTVRITNLAPALNGLRLLHLSDLHCDLDADFIPGLIQQLAGLEYDLCLITGDFRFRTFGSYAQAMTGMRQLKAALAAPTYAVLGNHDYLEMTADLEAMGIRVLLNEAVPIEHKGAQLWLAGVDDAHIYETADLNAAMRGIPRGETVVLLAHSPDLYPDAARQGIAFMLCGHTHGGQLCLPGGFMVIRNSRCGRRFCRGPWQHEGLQGYTSSGTGSSGLAARLNCPSEIVIHQLQGRS